MHLDDDGSLIIVGAAVTAPEVLAEIQQLSRIAPDELAVRAPKELKKAIWEACGGHDPHFD
ncbi:hypothetical protein ACFY19_20580 [Streptosporangium saharense]|uniref:hypothetical protein n=1 Tax=Streptosporangium saharense TaxID=1706840 RepID=UPI0036C671D6